MLSEDDNISSLNFHTPIEKFLDPSDQQSTITEDRLFFDDDYMLDTNQDLPIRKPQSAYVIFGKMVSLQKC